MSSLSVNAEVLTTRAPSLAECQGSEPATSQAFTLFMVVNATLFVRPSELVEAIADLPIYQLLIVTCLALSLSSVRRSLTLAHLIEAPLTACVTGLLVMVILSHLGNVSFVFAPAYEFFKVTVYFLLLVSLVNTPRRLQTFLFWFTVFAAAMVLLTVLSYHGAVVLPNLTPLADRQGGEIMGGEKVYVRLRGSGIFNDPNEFSLVVVFSIFLCMYCLTERSLGLARFFLALPLFLFVYALTLTQSRGGLLSLFAGTFVFCFFRFGKAKTILIGLLGVPLLFALFAGRQTTISTQESTARERIQLWSDGLTFFESNPVFGIGCEEYVNQAQKVGHNSYLHCFAELGFVGGALFIGAFYVCFRGLYRLRSAGRVIVDPSLSGLHPFLAAAFTGYATGLLTISYCYAVPTYTVIGVVTAFLGMTVTHPPIAPDRFDARLMLQFLLISVIYLVGIHVFVRMFFH